MIFIASSSCLHSNLVPIVYEFVNEATCTPDRQTHLHSQSWKVLVSESHFNIAAGCGTAIEAVVGYLGNKMNSEREHLRDYR